MEKLLKLNWINFEKRKKVFQCTLNYRMVLGLEFCIDSLCFGSNMQVGCVALWVSFLKCPRSSKSDFRAKSYSCFSDETFVTRLCDQTCSVSAYESSQRVRSVFIMRAGATGCYQSLVSCDKMRLEPLWKWTDSRRVESSHRRKESLVSCAKARLWPDLASTHPITGPRHVRSGVCMRGS
jgi:hypothetical protein